MGHGSGCSVSKSHNLPRLLARAAISAVSRRPVVIVIDGSCMRHAEVGRRSFGPLSYHRRAPPPQRRAQVRAGNASPRTDVACDTQRAWTVVENSFVHAIERDFFAPPNDAGSRGHCCADRDWQLPPFDNVLPRG